MKKNEVKTALMTWFHYKNYGTALQAYALQQYIIKLGYDNEIINYIPEKGKKERGQGGSSLLYRLRRKLNHLQLTPFFINETEDRFNEFVNMKLSKTPLVLKKDLLLLDNQYDIFFCGSDQIWSPANFEPVYFLSFVKDERKLISYAPSIGTPIFNDEEVKSEMMSLIQRFNSLSVRELSGSKLIQEYCGVVPRVVIDPTLLFDSNFWGNSFDDKTIRMKYRNQKYILCYFLGDYRKYEKYVKSVEKKLGYVVVTVPIYKQQLTKKGTIDQGIGPEEFVSLMKNASYICTDSFHGVAFAVNFSKEFTVFKRFKDGAKNSQNTRVYNLLNSLDLPERISLNNLPDSLPDKMIDYDKVQEKLSKLRQLSSDYIENAIKEQLMILGKE
nr:Polysaccharide pyruvyl transferase [Streptococcus suis]